MVSSNKMTIGLSEQRVDLLARFLYNLILNYFNKLATLVMFMTNVVVRSA